MHRLNFTVLLLTLLTLCKGEIVVQLSDIHLDTLYQVGAPTHCWFDVEGLPCCRNSSIAKIPSGHASSWGDLNCDLNLDTHFKILLYRHLIFLNQIYVTCRQQMTLSRRLLHLSSRGILQVIMILI